MRKQRTTLLVLFALVITAATAVVNLRGQSDSPARDPQTRDPQVRDPLTRRSRLARGGESNPAARDRDAGNTGSMTEVQKRHSKLHNRKYPGGQKLRDFPDGIDQFRISHCGGTGDETKATTTEELLKNLLCDADAVVVGVVSSKSSHFTEDDSAIFTDYDLSVEEIIKDNVNDRISSSGRLTVTRIGGMVETHGKPYRHRDSVFEPFEVGSRYLLLLRFVPDTGAYQALSSESSFELKRTKVRRLTEREPSYLFNYEDDAAAFVAQAHAAVGNCGSTRTEGDNE